MTEPKVGEILRASARRRRLHNSVDVDHAVRAGMAQLRRRMLAAYAAGAVVVVLLTAGTLVAHFNTVAQPGSTATTGSGEITTTTTPTTTTARSTRSTTTTTHGTGTTKPALTSVRIDPDHLSIAIGKTQQLKAIGSYSDNHDQDITDTVTWTSRNPHVADVDGSGMVTAVGDVAAETEIVATSGQVSAHATVVTTAAAATLTAITLTGDPPNDCRGTFSLVANGTYSDGSTKSITTEVQWTSSNSTYANVSANGLVTLAWPARVPSAVITATLNGVQGTFTVSCRRPTTTHP